MLAVAVTLFWLCVSAQVWSVRSACQPPKSTADDYHITEVTPIGRTIDLLPSLDGRYSFVAVSVTNPQDLFNSYFRICKYEEHGHIIRTTKVFDLDTPDGLRANDVDILTMHMIVMCNDTTNKNYCYWQKLHVYSVDEYRPQFEQVVTARISELEPVGKKILSLRDYVIDRDWKDRNRTYTFERIPRQGEVAPPFQVQGNGDVVVSQELNGHPTEMTYEFDVLAKSGRLFTVQGKVNITTVNTNDHPPVFVFEPSGRFYHANISDKIMGQNLTILPSPIKAVDPDGDKIEYSFKNASAYVYHSIPLFYIERATGIVRKYGFMDNYSFAHLEVVATSISNLMYIPGVENSTMADLFIYHWPKD